MKLARTLAVQAGASFLALLASSFVVFSALYIAPGNPITVLAGGRQLSPASKLALSHYYHLDAPFLTRYWGWLSELSHGNLGISIDYHVPVTTLIGPRLVSTLLLLGMAAMLMLVFGIGMGLLAALGGSKIDTGMMVLSSLGVALPTFIAAILLISIFSVGLGWFPVFGSGSGVGDQIYHLVLPSIALSIAGLSTLARVTRISVRTEASREHVETARSRGLRESDVIRRHVFRNAMIPISTVAGLTIAGTIAGTVVVETAFGLNGLGSLLVNSVTAKDFAVVQVVSLILIALFLVVNLLVDLSYVLMDPRIRRGGVS